MTSSSGDESEKGLHETERKTHGAAEPSASKRSEVVFERVPRDGINSLFFPPTVWVGLTRHPKFAGADLSGLRKAF